MDETMYGYVTLSMASVEDPRGRGEAHHILELPGGTIIFTGNSSISRLINSITCVINGLTRAGQNHQTTINNKLPREYVKIVIINYFRFRLM